MYGMVSSDHSSTTKGKGGTRKETSTTNSGTTSRSSHQPLSQQPSQGHSTYSSDPVHVSQSHQLLPQQSHHSQHRHRRVAQPRSIYSRFWTFIKETWTGVKFALVDSDLDETENQPRHRPENLKSLCRLTKFTETEIKRIYRGFKAECPSGILQEETFRDIYAQFFPQGANTGRYAHYVFNALDQNGSGLISFGDFVLGLSVLSRGSLEDKLHFIHRLYDLNHDGFITKEEMKEVVTAIYELMGNCAEPIFEESTVQERVDRIFEKMDQNHDGRVSLDEFIDTCLNDENISKSICVFDSVI